MLLRRMYILWVWGGDICRRLLCLFCPRFEFKSWISLIIFCLVDLSNIDSGVLKSPTIFVWESKSLCRPLRTCFMYLGDPELGAFLFRVISSSCCIDPFTIM